MFPSCSSVLNVLIQVYTVLFRCKNILNRFIIRVTLNGAYKILYEIFQCKMLRTYAGKALHSAGRVSWYCITAFPYRDSLKKIAEAPLEPITQFFYYHFWSVVRSIVILKVEKYGMELDTRRIWRYGLCQRSEQLWIAVCEPSRSWYVPSFSGRILFWKKTPLLWDIPRKKCALSFLYQQIPERFWISWVGTL